MLCNTQRSRVDQKERESERERVREIANKMCECNVKKKIKIVRAQIFLQLLSKVQASSSTLRAVLFPVRAGGRSGRLSGDAF